MEILIAFTIFTSLFGVGYQVFRVFAGKTSENLSKRLVLQMEARKALITLYRELQEGIEVINPAPGTTLPYLVYKDYVNNIRTVFLEEDPKQTKEQGSSMYRVMIVARDPSSSSVEEPRCIMHNVKKLTFTTYNPGGVLISAMLKGGSGEFSLVNFVRLQNMTAEDDL